MVHKVFIDGQEGTTGLKLTGRLQERDDIQLLQIDPEKRKDITARREMLDAADLTFLCLPDEASREIVRQAGPTHRILDTSTAFRTAEGWIYGMPELEPAQPGRIRSSNRTAVPGCHATGYILLIRPLVEAGLVDGGSMFFCGSVTGYSGGGRKMIEQYMKNRQKPAAEQDPALEAPRQYALSQTHKHLPEMTRYSQAAQPPVFNPLVCSYYSGMLIQVPLNAGLLRRFVSKESLISLYRKRYADQPLVHVSAQGEEPEDGFIPANGFAGYDDLEIFVTGTEDRLLLTARYDNLGKGASGAAVQCMNLMLDLPQETGLVLHTGSRA